MNILNFKNISWAKKLFFANFPIILLSLSIIFLSYKITIDQSNSYIEIIEDSKNTVTVIEEVIGAINNNQLNLTLLVASNNKKDIRQYAINSIKSFALIDESISKLDGYLKPYEKLDKLKSALAEVKPISMSVIKNGKANNDKDAMIIFNDNRGLYQEVKKIAFDVSHE